MKFGVVIESKRIAQVVDLSATHIDLRGWPDKVLVSVAWSTLSGKDAHTSGLERDPDPGIWINDDHDTVIDLSYDGNEDAWRYLVEDLQVSWEPRN